MSSRHPRGADARLLVLGVVLTYVVVGWLQLIHHWEGASELREPPALLHWLRDSTLALPLVMPAIWFAESALTRLALAYPERARDGSACIAVATIGSFAVGCAALLHDWLFGSFGGQLTGLHDHFPQTLMASFAHMTLDAVTAFPVALAATASMAFVAGVGRRKQLGGPLGEPPGIEGSGGHNDRPTAVGDSRPSALAPSGLHLTRRDAMRLGVVGGATLAFPFERLASALEGRILAEPPIAPFSVPLPIPEVLKPTRRTRKADYYELTMKEGIAHILPGLETPIWGYNGLYPGPTIEARSGRRTVVRQHNRLPVDTVIHLHGGHQRPGSDGFPTDYIHPRHYKDYFYPNHQIAAQLWYHDHTMDVTGHQVYMGLAAFYNLTDAVEESFPLPKGRFDVPIVIQDRIFNRDGSLHYPRDHLEGVKGNIILVNGAVQPRFAVAKRKYRFRILNGSNGRVYKLALSSGRPFTLIGTEGGLRPRPLKVPVLPIVPAERYQVVVDFSDYPVGSSIVLKNLGGGRTTSDIMRFDVVRRAKDDSFVPRTLRSLDVLDEKDAVRKRTFVFDYDDRWTIDGKPFDPNRIDAQPVLDTVEVWNFINDSGDWVHFIHLHDVMFQILGNRVVRKPWEYGWKDTVFLGPDESARCIMKFTDNVGRYVFHCHFLEHEDMRMMGTFQVERG